MTEAQPDQSQPVPPFPLAEGQAVRLTITVDATVYAEPDPESDPTQSDYLWSLAYMSGCERVIVSLTQDEVAARVRKEVQR